MPRPPVQPLIAVLGTVLLVVATYVGLTEGLERLNRTEGPVTANGPGYLPEIVFDPPETVPSTADRGPVGPVSLVFADDPAAGEPVPPWIAVSSQTGDYRTLSAPHLPPYGPRAVVVSPDGTGLAWGYDDGLVLYDTVRDRARTVTDGLGPVRTVGGFSPDGGHVTAYDGQLRVIDVATGSVAGTLSGLDGRQAKQAVWTPDGAALSYVGDRALITRSWAGDAIRETEAPIATDATLAWSPRGDQLAASRRTRHAGLVDILEVTPAGKIIRAATLRREQHTMQRLLGYGGDDRVVLLGLSAETGPLPKLYELRTSGAPEGPDLVSLPPDARLSASLQVGARPLRNGSWAYPEPDWPVSDGAKLVASVLIGVFVLGLYTTRRRA